MNVSLLDLSAEEEVEMGELSSTLGFLLRLAQLKGFQGYYAAVSEDGMKPGEFTVLRLIALNPGMRQGLLARTLRIKPAHMTKLVQRMVDAGLVERTVPPEDRRSVTLAVTDEGQAFVTSQARALRAFEQQERGTFTDEEFDQLIALLQKFIAEGHSR